MSLGSQCSNQCPGQAGQAGSVWPREVGGQRSGEGPASCLCEQERQQLPGLWSPRPALSPPASHILTMKETEKQPSCGPGRVCQQGAGRGGWRGNRLFSCPSPPPSPPSSSFTEVLQTCSGSHLLKAYTQSDPSQHVYDTITAGKTGNVFITPKRVPVPL